MQLKIDSTKCDGFGPCADAAPELFRLDERGHAELRRRGTIAPDEEDLARRATDACPVGAIMALEAT